MYYLSLAIHFGNSPCIIYGQILQQCLLRARVMHAFKKGYQITSFFSLLKREPMIQNPATRPFFNTSGPLVSSNRATRGRIVDKAKRIGKKYENDLEVHGFRKKSNFLLFSPLLLRRGKKRRKFELEGAWSDLVHSCLRQT